MSAFPCTAAHPRIPAMPTSFHGPRGSLQGRAHTSIRAWAPEEARPRQLSLRARAATGAENQRGRQVVELSAPARLTRLLGRPPPFDPTWPPVGMGGTWCPFLAAAKPSVWVTVAVADAEPSRVWGQNDRGGRIGPESGPAGVGVRRCRIADVNGQFSGPVGGQVEVPTPRSVSSGLLATSSASGFAHSP